MRLNKVPAFRNGMPAYLDLRPSANQCDLWGLSCDFGTLYPTCLTFPKIIIEQKKLIVETRIISDIFVAEFLCRLTFLKGYLYANAKVRA